MATGKEIKRLRGSISALKAAELIGVDVERLRKWEARDADPKDSGDILKVEEYFGLPLSDLSKLDNFQWKVKLPHPNGDGVRDKDKIIALLEKQNALLEERLQEKGERVQILDRVLHDYRDAMQQEILNLKSSLGDLQLTSGALLAYAKTLYQAVQHHRAAQEKVPLEQMQHDMDTMLASFADQI